MCLLKGTMLFIWSYSNMEVIPRLMSQFYKKLIVSFKKKKQL